MRVLQGVRIVMLALVAALALAAPAAAQNFPALSGRVVDEAGVLDAGARATLTRKLAELEAKTSDQVVVATVKSLQGYTVEDYANRLFRAWRLGQATQNNGVLLLVAPSDRKVRIEVGYGLEGTLPDAVAKLIIEDALVPRLRAGQFEVGIESGVDDIIQVLTGDSEQWKRRIATPSGPHVIELPLVLGWVVFALFVGVAGIMAALGVYIVVFLLIRFLIFAHVLPQRKNRNGSWLWLNHFDDDKYDKRGRRISGHAWASSSGSSSSSDSSDSFSGGGGSSGGGGASGSW